MLTDVKAEKETQNWITDMKTKQWGKYKEVEWTFIESSSSPHFIHIMWMQMTYRQTTGNTMLC